MGPGQTMKSVSDKVGGIVLEGRHPKSWLLGFALAFLLLMLLLFSVSYLLYKGVGIWGINMPVAWPGALIGSGSATRERLSRPSCSWSFSNGEIPSTGSPKR